jgi:hypothetical protein
LCNIKPQIWRGLEVPATITLPKLHRAIQIVVGWEDCHQHQFKIGEAVYEIPDPDDPYGKRHLDERRVKLASVINRVGTEFAYVYDYGDNWEHRLLLEAIVDSQSGTTYPRCTVGARSGPPEDVGGPYAYQDYLEALADPKGERHEELLEWRGPFDPERFDLDVVNRALVHKFSPRRTRARDR